MAPGSILVSRWSRDKASAAPNPEAAEKIVNGMRERNILIGIAGRHGNVLKIRPPLCFTREHADIFLEGFRAALAAAS